MNVNQAAFCTSTFLAATTIASTFKAVAATDENKTMKMVAYTALAILSGSISLASITAWTDPRSSDVKKYFTNLKEHSAYAITGVFQMISQALVQALVQGAVRGVSRKIERRIAGPDMIIEKRYTGDKKKTQ